LFVGDGTGKVDGDSGAVVEYEGQVGKDDAWFMVRWGGRGLWWILVIGHIVSIAKVWYNFDQ
jgi:hypothetical protein